MKKHEATQLLDKTFNSAFDINNYVVFIKELFNSIGIQYLDKSQYIANQYREYISKVIKLGDYAKDRKKMEILAVKLKKTSSRDRARTMQRNFIANWLEKYNIEAALVAFYGEEPDDWRFSFVKMEYNLVRNKEGKVKVAKELTPAKRYSYLVGINEPNHTCRSQFLDLVMEEDIQPSLFDIENAFSIEKVTKEFFEKYKKRVIDLRESLDLVVKNDKRIQKEFEERGIDTIDFSKMLLGQIVFIYFLQKKGWLGIKRDKSGEFGEYGTGPKNFLRRLFDGDYGNYKNFFNDMLEPLFYQALANDRNADNDYYDKFKCKIPFLNGGLFEPINEYDWVKTDILIDNPVFKEILKTFDEFNFTVKEDEPLEKEVAVDPEMLGKVFENLLEVKERKDKGAFYTPREIVHYMCQQSLINYLETNTSVPREDIENFIQLGDLTLANDQRILMVLESKRNKLARGVISPTRFEKEFNQLLDQFSLPRSIIDMKRIIDKLLREIKIVDPAVGSGAFPMGMMNEIVKARGVLTIFFDPDEQEERTVYSHKRECIENSLYGVDIDLSAVEIAKLRFWLALIVDEEKKENINPLPNLDHKIMCGNSLLEEFEGIKLFDDNLLKFEDTKSAQQYEIERIKKQLESLYKLKGRIVLGKEKGESLQDVEAKISKLERRKKKLLKPKMDKNQPMTIEEALQQRKRESQSKLSDLRVLHKKYFNEENRDKKKAFREKIDTLEWELIEITLQEQNHPKALQKLNQYKKKNVKPFFLWKLYFAEIFQRENPGFDVVIANPPYVEHKKLKEFSQAFKFSYTTYSGTADLYVYFYEQGFNLLRAAGVLTFITSNKFIKTSYGKKLKQYLSERYLLELIDFTDVRVFEALVASCVLICKNSQISFFSFRMTNVKDDFSLKNSIHKYFEENGIILGNDRLDGDNWRLEDESLFKIKEKVNLRGEKIATIPSINVYRGITTGFNPAFIIDRDLKSQLVNMDFNNTDIIKPLLQGRNIRKWIYSFNETYILQTGYEINIKTKYPKIFEHLNQYSEDLIQRADQGINWWNLRACKYYDEFEREKIIWGLTADKWAFAYDNNKHYLPSNGYILTSNKVDIKLILGQLNSKISQFYFSLIGIITAGGAYTLKHETIIEFPIIYNTQSDDEIIKLVNEILVITENDDYFDNQDSQNRVKMLEKTIDQILYNAYQLTPNEIELIEETLKESK